MTRTQRAIFVDFRTEIGRSQKSHFLSPNIATRAHITQNLVFLNLSRASCIFGHVDIKRVTLYVNQRPEAGRMPYQKETGLFSTPSVNCYGHVANITSQKQVQEPWMFRKETKYPCTCKKWGALMKHFGGWLLFEQHLFVPKHVTLSQKMRLALLVSIPAPCFFDQQAVHDKNSKGDIRGFPNWDWKISKESLSISEHCKKAPHHTTSCFLEPFSSFLHIWSCWHQVNFFMLAGGRHVNPNLFQ